jgi:hypothetical protein
MRGCLTSTGGSGNSSKKIRAGTHLYKIHPRPDYAVVIIVSLFLLSFPRPFNFNFHLSLQYSPQSPEKLLL